MRVQYYCGTIALKNVFGLHNAQFAAIGGERSKHNRYDGYSRLVGHTAEGADAVMPVSRTIYYKSHPSMHKCDGRCVNAKGHDCECSCGGENHGKGSI